jgi:hypothetical protein
MSAPALESTQPDTEWVRGDSFKYNQQDATLYNILYYCQCSTCFRRFLRPSSGAQNLYTQHRVYVELAAATASMDELEQLTHASGSSKQAWHIPDVVCTVFELLMRGVQTAWNMQSIYSNKEYSITLHLVGYTYKNTLTMHGPMNFREYRGVPFPGGKVSGTWNDKSFLSGIEVKVKCRSKHIPPICFHPLVPEFSFKF